MEATKNNDSITLTLALSYGARAELTAAARNLSQKVLEGQITPDDIDENAYASELWSAALPDVDLLIRTGGDKRISNFLLWKIAYAELHFTNTLWPDFGEQDFMEAVEDFGSRRRRFGKA
jgi:undecaprenyl diphosphate synthase